jgi:hypothetical protein
VSGDTSVYQLASKARPGRLLGVPVVEEAYSFHEHRFFMANAWIDGESNFERVKEALTKQYGEPSGKIKDYQKKAKIDDQSRDYKHTLVWRWPDSSAEVRLSYRAARERATVTFIDEATRKATATPASEPATEEKATAAP